MTRHGIKNFYRINRLITCTTGVFCVIYSLLSSLAYLGNGAPCDLNVMDTGQILRFSVVLCSRFFLRLVNNGYLSLYLAYFTPILSLFLSEYTCVLLSVCLSVCLPVHYGSYISSS